MTRSTSLGTAGVVVSVGLVGLVGCGSPSRAPGRASATVGPPSVSPSTSASAACPEPAPAVVAPVDFPHPTPTVAAPDATNRAADDALASQGLAATSTFGGPVSTSAFRHYLDATGSYLTLPVDDLLRADPALVTALDAALVTAGAAAVARAAAMSTCVSVPFTSGWQAFDAITGDWHYTLGHFRAEVIGTATPVAPASGTVRVAYRAAIGDTYDFDPGTPFARFARLADDGRAATFLDGGLTTPRSVTVTGGTDLASPGFG